MSNIESQAPLVPVHKKNKLDFRVLEFRAWLYRRRLRRFLYWPHISGIGRVTRRIGPKAFIKGGGTVRFVEAQTMAFVRAHTSIPVPRPYEVLLDSCGRHYIVMEYIDACELTITWSSLSEDQQKDIISELGRYWNELRQIPATGPAVCAVDGGTVKDHQGREFGPFPSFQDFATLYGYFILRGKCDSSTEQILENFLAKEHRIVFTHCDLAPRNILVKDGRIASIIDWECAGWFPEYWEANQVEYSNGLEIPDFGDKFIKSILPGFENEQRLEYELSRHIFRG